MQKQKIFPSNPKAKPPESTEFVTFNLDKKNTSVLAQMSLGVAQKIFASGGLGTLNSEQEKGSENNPPGLDIQIQYGFSKEVKSGYEIREKGFGFFHITKHSTPIIKDIANRFKLKSPISEREWQHLIGLFLQEVMATMSEQLKAPDWAKYALAWIAGELKLIFLMPYQLSSTKTTHMVVVFMPNQVEETSEIQFDKEEIKQKKIKQKPKKNIFSITTVYPIMDPSNLLHAKIINGKDHYVPIDLGVPLPQETPASLKEENPIEKSRVLNKIEVSLTAPAKKEENHEPEKARVDNLKDKIKEDKEGEKEISNQLSTKIEESKQEIDPRNKKEEFDQKAEKASKKKAKKERQRRNKEELLKKQQLTVIEEPLKKELDTFELMVQGAGGLEWLLSDVIGGGVKPPNSILMSVDVIGASWWSFSAEKITIEDELARLIKKIKEWLKNPALPAWDKERYNTIHDALDTLTTLFSARKFLILLMALLGGGAGKSIDFETCKKTLKNYLEISLEAFEKSTWPLHLKLKEILKSKKKIITKSIFKPAVEMLTLLDLIVKVLTEYSKVAITEKYMNKESGMEIVAFMMHLRSGEIFLENSVCFLFDDPISEKAIEFLALIRGAKGQNFSVKAPGPGLVIEDKSATESKVTSDSSKKEMLTQGFRGGFFTDNDAKVQTNLEKLTNIPDWKRDMKNCYLWTNEEIGKDIRQQLRNLCPGEKISLTKRVGETEGNCYLVTIPLGTKLARKIAALTEKELMEKSQNQGVTIKNNI